MKHALKICPLIIYYLVAANALPTSVVEQVKSDDINNKKVKRAQLNNLSDTQKEAFFNPTAIKRGVNDKTEQLPLLTEWDQQRFRQPASDSFPSPLYNNEDELDDKTINEYEKGFRYGTNRDKIDEALENAILKTEMYGDPAALNQYRYYGNDESKRKRRNAQKSRMLNRFKRDVNLSPEDILAILTFWENERQQQHHQQQQSSYRNNWPRYDSPYDLDLNKDDQNDESSDEDWLDSPVYPHINEHTNPTSSNYYYDAKPPQIFEKRGTWGSFGENSNKQRKRFMVAKKRAGPAHDLQYLNVPPRNDFYSLSDLLGSQPDPNVPLYRRYIL